MLSISKSKLKMLFSFTLKVNIALSCHFFAQLEHPHLSVMERPNFRWSLSSISHLKQYVHLLDHEPLREIMMSILHLYKTCVDPKRPYFRKCKYDFYSPSTHFIFHPSHSQKRYSGKALRGCFTVFRINHISFVDKKNEGLDERHSTTHFFFALTFGLIHLQRQSI